MLFLYEDEVLADFQICLSVPLRSHANQMTSPHQFLQGYVECCFN